MKSTGVIRRIDELGRIVIPKEIRRHLGIREGENLEIFTEEDKIVLKKYSKVLEFSDFSEKLCEIIPSVMDLRVIITDRDKVISFSNNLKLELNNCAIEQKLMKNVQDRENYESITNETLTFHDQSVEGYFCIQPIISAIDCLGLIILIKNSTFSKEEKQFAKFISQIVANKIDIL